MLKVIYHANCCDGFCGAYLFWKYFVKGPGTSPNLTIEFIPMNYGVVLDLTKFNKEDIVYLIDFSFKRDVLLALAEVVKELWVLDHHKTAYDDLCGLSSQFAPNNLHIFFDMERSGAQLAYDYLVTRPTNSEWVHPNSLPRVHTYPVLVDYVADRDLWRFVLPNSKEINMYIRSFKFIFEEWQKIDDLLSYGSGRSGAVISGIAILRYQELEIESAVSHAKLHVLTLPNTGEKLIVPAVNSTVNFSEVAGQLATGNNMGIAWFQRSDGKFQYSLRSEPHFDCSKVAKAFGGGGHKTAAGFESDIQVLVLLKEHE